jgi:hypothetical protein
MILTILVVAGAAAGLMLHRQQSPPSPGPPPLVQTPLPKIPGLDPTVSMDSGKAPAGPAASGEIKTLQDQVAYLQDQVDLLMKENSDLMDRLANITGRPSPAMPPSSGPCTPAASPSPEGETPDFVGIGIELVKTRELKDIPVVTSPASFEDVEKHIAQWLGTQFAAGHGERQGRALAAIGAIPEPVDTIALKAAFWAHQIGGWYSAQDQTLFVVQNGSDRENALALAYGYLFKHFGKTLFPPNDQPVTIDNRLARESLLAGDAALTRFLHALRDPIKGGGGGVGEDPDDPSRSVPIPNFLREMELLPFGMGLDFMQAMHSIGDWDQVNATYARPPQASAEILDPELYLNEVPFSPGSLKITDKTVAGSTPVWEDSMGPLGLVLLLKQHVPEPIAAGTAPGWSNDLWLTYPHQATGTGPGPARDHAVWHTLWKDSNGADAFFAAMRTGLLSRYRGASQDPAAEKGVFQLQGAPRSVLMVRTHGGRGVLFIDAGDAAFAKAARDKYAPPGA